MSMELVDRGSVENSKRNYMLIENKTLGFSNAVKNGQTRLALEYAQVIINELSERVNELESSNGSDNVPVQVDEVKSTPKARTTKKVENESPKLDETSA